MYPRNALRRKRVATLLLRPDHTRRQTFVRNAIDVAGRATVRAKYEINLPSGDGPDARKWGDYDPEIDVVDRFRICGSSRSRPTISTAAATRRNEPGQ